MVFDAPVDDREAGALGRRLHFPGHGADYCFQRVPDVERLLSEPDPVRSPPVAGVHRPDQLSLTAYRRAILARLRQHLWLRLRTGYPARHPLARYRGRPRSAVPILPGVSDPVL